jgi:hypothetical protein
MKRIITSIAAIALISGCATAYKPVPDGYTGPTASIKDSFNAISSSKVEFFYVEQVDGHEVANSRFGSLAANRGRGMYMNPVRVERPVPIKPVTLSIVARTEYAAPILVLTHEVFQVKGNLQFTPNPGKTYVVRGNLGETNAAVWLEEENSREVIGEKIQANGSSKLGLFEK